MPVHAADEKSVFLSARTMRRSITWSLRRNIETAEDEAGIKALDFIEEDLQSGFLPAALKARPDAVEIRLREGVVIRHIHVGAGKPTCQFDVDWRQRPEAFRRHLAPMRRLAEHANAVAKYEDFTGHPEEAAAIYADVAQMCAHIAKGTARSSAGLSPSR